MNLKSGLKILTMSEPIKNTSLYLLQIAISGVLMLALMPIISKYLSPNDFGMFILAQVYTGIAVGIANLGMLVGYERNFFIFEKLSDKSALLISSAIIFVALNLLTVLVLVYLFQIEINSLIFSINPPGNFLIIVLIGTSVSSLSQYYLTFLKNSNMALVYIKYTIVNSIIYFVVALVLITQSSLGPMSLAYAWAMSSMILFISLFLNLGKRLPLSFDMEMLKEMLKISLPLTPKVFFGVINTHIDKILLSFIGSSGLVGIYHMGQTFALTVFQFMTGLGKVFQPEIYRKLFANNNINNPYEIYRYLLPFLYFSIFVALIVVLFSREFVSMFLSSKYQGATPIIIILSLYYISLFFGKITGIQLIYAKKTHITTVLIFLGAAINVGLNIPFIINWGIVGAAWATAISGIVMTIVSYIVAQKYTKIAWQWRVVFTMYGLFLVAVIFSIIDYDFLIHSHVSLIIKLLIILLYIIIGKFLGFFSLSEIRKLILKKGID